MPIQLYGHFGGYVIELKGVVIITFTPFVSVVPGSQHKSEGLWDNQQGYAIWPWINLFSIFFRLYQDMQYTFWYFEIKIIIKNVGN